MSGGAGGGFFALVTPPVGSESVPRLGTARASLGAWGDPTRVPVWAQARACRPLAGPLPLHNGGGVGAALVSVAGATPGWGRGGGDTSGGHGRDVTSGAAEGDVCSGGRERDAEGVLGAGGTADPAEPPPEAVTLPIRHRSGHPRGRAGGGLRVLVRQRRGHPHRRGDLWEAGSGGAARAPSFPFLGLPPQPR